MAIPALWLGGWAQRACWTFQPEEPTLHPPTTGSNDTLVVMVCGAFADATIVYERQLDLLRQVGCVAMFRYPPLRFSEAEMAKAIYTYATRRGFKHVIVDGMSEGSRVALRLVEHNETQPNPIAIQGLVLREPFLDAGHIKDSRVLYAKYIHAGPVLNLFSRLVTFWLFEELVTDKSTGVDPDHRRRHVRAMRGLRLSALLDQAAATADPHKYVISTMPPTVVMHCDASQDAVLYVAEATRDVCALVGGALVGDPIGVIGSHAALVEYQRGRCDRTVRGFLEIRTVRTHNNYLYIVYAVKAAAPRFLLGLRS